MMNFDKDFPSFDGKGLHNIYVVLGSEILVKRTSHYSEEEIAESTVDIKKYEELKEKMKEIENIYYACNTERVWEIQTRLSNLLKKNQQKQER